LPGSLVGIGPPRQGKKKRDTLPLLSIHLP
jgi:hypothetical protein